MFVTPGMIILRVEGARETKEPPVHPSADSVRITGGGGVALPLSSSLKSTKLPLCSRKR